MTDKRIVYARPDGGVTVVIPAPKFMARFASEADGLAAVQAKSVPADATDVEVCVCDALPPNGEYRDAWERDTSRSRSPVKISIPKARDIHASLIRDACRQKAKDLIERETMGEDVTAEKAALRNVDEGPAIRAATTLDQLRAVWPHNVPRPG